MTARKKVPLKRRKRRPTGPIVLSGAAAPVAPPVALRCPRCMSSEVGSKDEETVRCRDCGWEADNFEAVKAAEEPQREEPSAGAALDDFHLLVRSTGTMSAGLLERVVKMLRLLYAAKTTPRPLIPEKLTAPAEHLWRVASDPAPPRVDRLWKPATF